MESAQEVALVHDWLVGMRGGEKVLEILCELFPGATLFTLVHRKGSVSPVIESRPIRTSFLQNLPFGLTHYRYFLPLYPEAARGLDAREFRFVVSSSHAAAKGVRVGPGTIHVCYCHTPMRYLWDRYDDYFGPGRASLPVRGAMRSIRARLRKWDVATATGVAHFIANSRAVEGRIQRIYGRESTVIYPPVDVSRFQPENGESSYYLIVSALVPYKRIDIAVEALTRSKERLIIVGTGPEERKLRSMAGSNIEFKGWVSDAELAGYYARSRALIFPGEEDFGIAPVEAMACGKPVVAFAGGGVLESVVEGRTGVFFTEQNSASLLGAIDRLRMIRFDPEEIRSRALLFGRDRCKENLAEFFRKAFSA